MHGGSGESRPLDRGAGASGSRFPDRPAQRGDATREQVATAHGPAGDPPSPSLPVERGVAGAVDVAGPSNKLPTPLVLALIALGLVTIAGGVAALRRRSRADASGTRRPSHGTMA
jgi:hypothetical protein